MPERDDFSRQAKETLAKRVGWRCSNPGCRKLTAGPQQDAEGAVNIGVAAHVTAASPGGPRYDVSLAANQRSALQNGIWLCQSCAKLIDSDTGRYSERLLNRWKLKAEDAARRELEAPAALTNGDIEQLPFTRVLLPSVSAVREFSGDGSIGATIDYSVYPFVVEELVSVGVTRVVVVGGTGPEKSLPVLSSFIRDRISVIDTTDLAASVAGLFVPVANEFDVEFEFPMVPQHGIHVKRVKEPNREPLKSISHTCATLFPHLLTLAIGMKYHVQVEIDLTDARRAVSLLRTHLRSRSARDVLAAVNGVLAAYEETELDTIRCRPGSSANGGKLFRDLLEHPQYQAMARCGYELGSRGSLSAALIAFGDAARQLIERRSDLGRTARLLNIARSIPESIAAFGHSSYLPPILPLATVRSHAQEVWLRLLPEPVVDMGLPSNVKWGKASI